MPRRTCRWCCRRPRVSIRPAHTAAPHAATTRARRPQRCRSPDHGPGDIRSPRAICGQIAASGPQAPGRPPTGLDVTTTCQPSPALRSRNLPRRYLAPQGSRLASGCPGPFDRGRRGPPPPHRHPHTDIPHAQRLRAFGIAQWFPGSGQARARRAPRQGRAAQRPDVSASHDIASADSTQLVVEASRRSALCGHVRAQRWAARVTVLYITRMGSKASKARASGGICRKWQEGRSRWTFIRTGRTGRSLSVTSWSDGTAGRRTHSRSGAGREARAHRPKARI